MLSKGQVLTLDYAYRGQPFVQWIGSDINTGTLDYAYRGEPYCSLLEEDTIYLELAGAIAAVSSLYSNLSIDIALSGSLGASSSVNDNAFLRLYMFPTLQLSFNSLMSLVGTFTYQDEPIKPKTRGWREIEKRDSMAWSTGSKPRAAWGQINVPSDMGWSVKDKGSGFWRQILKADSETWGRDRSAKSVSDSED